MIRFLLALTILGSTAFDLKAAYNPYSPEVIKVTNTVLANANLATQTEFNNFNTTAVINTSSNVFTSVTSNGVFCIPGTYIVDVVLYQTGGTRTNVSAQVTVDSVSTGVKGASGYKRNSNGHSEATSTVHDLVQLTSTSKIGFDFQREANTGTVAIPVGQSMMRITRIKD